MEGEHQAAFQEIADQNGGNRFSGLPGHDESVEYVVERLEAAGYDPVVQPFDYLAFAVLGPSTLQQTAPNPVTYVQGVDFGVIDQSDPGDVTAAVTAVDLQLGLGNTSTSGCEAADFAGFPAGNIALLQRGTCTFELKAENAAAAGAVGIVIFNQGNLAAPTARASPPSRLPPTTPAASRCSAPPTRSGRRSPGLVPGAAHAGVRQHHPRDQDHLQRPGRDQPATTTTS